MDIVEEIRQNPESGARRLAAEYKAGLMTLARRFCHDPGDAEELVNATFAIVVENIESHLEQASFFGWMCQILTSLHSRNVRRLSNKDIVYPGVVPDAIDDKAWEEIYDNLDHLLVREALGKLEPDEKEILVLHYFLDIPISKIAKVLAIPAGTVKSRLHYARKALAAKLGVKAHEAAKKPGGKAMLIALALCALTALGAGARLAVVRLLSSPVSAEQQADNPLGGPRFVAAADTGGTTSTLPAVAEDGDPPATAVPDVPFAPNVPSSAFQGEQNMNTTLRTIAASAAFAAATGAPLTASAEDYVVNVPLGETKTIDPDLVSDIGAKNLVKMGRGKLVSSAEMVAYTGTITVREGAFEIRTTSDLGTAAGGTIVEDGGTLVINMSTKNQSFGNEIFTIAGTGDADYGAAIHQSDYHNNDQNKLFKYIVLSDDATIFSGTHLGLADQILTMNGHTLTLKGSGIFTFRHTKTPDPVGNLVSEVGRLCFRGGSNYTGDPSKTLTVRNGSTLVLGYPGDNAPPIWWNLVVEESGKVADEASQGSSYYGDVEWNSTATEGASGSLTFEGDVTGTGTIKASNATLTFSKPLGANVSLGLSGTATAALPPPNAYSYEHAGLMVGRFLKDSNGDAWWEFNNNKVSEWKLCLEGPGPQIDQSYWKKGYWGESPADETISGKTSLGAKGYIWNRESTNVTFHVWCRVLYKTYVSIGGSTCFTARNDAVDKDLEVSIPANSCLPFLSMTAGSGNSTPGPYNSTTGLKINGGPTLRDNGNGWYFTTNAVSGVANPADLPSLSLADDGAIDMNGMPLSVDALSGAGIVTNTTTLTISNSWTLAAADIADGAKLVVDGALAFGNGCSLAVTDLSNLSTAASYTVASADSITGIAAAGVEVSDKGRTWKFVLSGDGKSIDLVYVPQATAIIMR